MIEELLIKNTTREQREKIICDSLACGEDDYERYNDDGAYGGIDPFDMYKPYIDGEKELSEISHEYRANFIQG